MTSAQTPPPAFTMPVQLAKVAGAHRDPAPAAPHVRRLAREIGVDIHSVQAAAPVVASAKTTFNYMPRTRWPPQPQQL